MKTLITTKGYVCLLDDEDYDWARRFIWSQDVNKHTVYVQRGRRVDGVYEKIQLHREIFTRQGIDINGLEIDHEDGNGLNNQRYNIRPATQSQNGANRIRHFGTSKYKGVCRRTDSLKWRAQINFEGKWVHLGTFTSELEAAKAYNAKATELFGEFAKLNEV